MRCRHILLALAFPVSIAAQARSTPESEIGFRAGFARLSMDDGLGGTDRVTHIALPGVVFASPGGVHWTLFMTEKLAIEPQLGYIRTSSDGFASSLMFLALQPQYFLRPDARRAPYLFAHVGILRDTDSGGGSTNTDSQNVFGGGVGYRKVLRRVIATRYELRFRRFSADGPGGEELNEVALLFGLGMVIPRGGSQ